MGVLNFFNSLLNNKPTIHNTNTKQNNNQENIFFQKSKKENIKIVKFNWHLDESNVKTEGGKIYTFVKKLPKGDNLIFDFKDLKYLNSLWLGYISDWHVKITDQDGQIIIINANENILDILDVIGIKQIIPTLKDINSAYRKIVSLQKK